ncbi:helix-turn-helix transcriptional regulator [Brevibacterium aurantiacum]|uniref:AraC family transcriptional regulator n=1 Tax=Brevibacterium aurantiacum TaxID=273384 RepID=A0A556CAP7_BREAU|nr:helix-turn-helix transcriptional regulator [Brevibacterium aurantiacum]TSI14108.1 AraC family transcriptional regulator [Brevibacterium aurantiacum]
MTAEWQSTTNSYSKGPALSGCGNEDQADAWLRQRGTGWFRPILARTTTVYRPLGPFAYDCVKLIVVRDGSAILYSRYFGERHIKPGDAILLGPGVLCGSEPEGHNTVTTVYLDLDYALDQLFWQHVGILDHRCDSYALANTLYTEPAQVLALGEERAGLLFPWLDDLVSLSVAGAPRNRFQKMQSLWASIADEIAPFIRTNSPQAFVNTSPGLTARYRRFQPLRPEAQMVHDALTADLSRCWTMGDLARIAHLSERQLSRVYSDAYGKTPLAHLVLLRVQEMSRLFRETDLSVGEVAQAVGWRSRSHASETFRRATGISPQRYRSM